MKFVDPPGPSPTINVLLYGPPKTGKSTGASTAPGPILYVNADLPTATRYARLMHGDTVREVALEGFDTLVDVTKAVYAEDFKTVVVDPVGEMYRIILEEESKRAIRPSLNEYGNVGVHIERFCRALCKAPVNTIFVCHDQPVKDEGADEVLTLPWTGTSNPKLGRVLMGMVDIVGYTGTVPGEGDVPQYVAQLVPGKGRSGGDRFNVLGPHRTVDLIEWLQIIEAQEATAKENA